VIGRSRWRLIAVAASVVGCRHHDTPVPSEPDVSVQERALATLHAFEERSLRATSFATLPPSDVVLGADPYRIATLPGGGLVGLLRGESAVVMLGDDGVERARLAAPRSASGLAVSAAGDVLVVGAGERGLAVYRADHGQLERVASIPIDVLDLRDVALTADATTAYVVEEREGRLLELSLERDRTRALRRTALRELGRCHGPIDVVAIAGLVAVNCLLDHTIEIRRANREVTRIHHDGPMWSLALQPESDGGVLIAVGGVEDHPLEREDGGFGYIDSYVTLYRLAPGADQPARLAIVNTSALGVVTPKWLAFRAAGTTVQLTVAGFASDQLVTLTWRGDLADQPEVAHRELPPGTCAAQLTSGGALVAASSLLEAWVVVHRDELRIIPIASQQPIRSVASRIGELLFFTTMMAPWNDTQGKLSRFTCETCHFEGYVDGRTHYTGRGNVYATTRPLYGLFNNRPYFSRALDKTMTDMVHAEFRVANRHNGRDPWFGLTRADLPWLSYIDGAPAELSPEYLREALMTFFMGFTHRTNPAAVDHVRFTPLEQAGAGVFRDRCVACHAARLVADDPASTVAFERWEPLVLSASGPIVWGRAGYEKTGVTPYVHDNGTRVPTLRRIYKKWPYFTNGSGRALVDVLDRFAWDAQRSYHDGGGSELQRLTADDKAALLAFLAVL
jgi:hypothetical protein